MRLRGLARTDFRVAAPAKRNGGSRMVGRAERTERNYTLIAELARDRVYLCNFERFLECQIGHNRRYTARKHGLARTRRAVQKYIVPAGNGYFEGAFRGLLSPYKRHVRVIRTRCRSDGKAARFYGRELLFAREKGYYLRKRG